MKSQGWSQITVLVTALLLAGCGGGGSNLAPTTPPGGAPGGGGGGGATPPPPPVNPASNFTGSVTVIYQGAPRAGLTVNLTQGAGVIATAQTNAQGVATFPNLVSGPTYCYSVSFSPQPGTNVNGTRCSNSTDPVRLELG